MKSQKDVNNNLIKTRTELSKLFTRLEREGVSNPTIQVATFLSLAIECYVGLISEETFMEMAKESYLYSKNSKNPFIDMIRKERARVMGFDNTENAEKKIENGIKEMKKMLDKEYLN